MNIVSTGFTQMIKRGIIIVTGVGETFLIMTRKYQKPCKKHEVTSEIQNSICYLSDDISAI